MDVSDFIMIGFVLLIGSVIQSAAGFAFGLFAIPLLLLATDLEPYEAIAAVTTCAVMQSIAGLCTIRGETKWRQILPLVLVAMATQPIGVWLLSILHEFGADRIRQTFGAVLLAVLFVQWWLKPSPREQVRPEWGFFAYACCGLMSGLSGMGGPPIVLWLMAHQWSTRRTRATLWFTFALLGPTNLVYQSLRFGPEVWRWSGIAVLYLPIVLLGLPPGIWLGNRMPKAQLRRVAFGLLFAVAAWSIIHSWVIPN